MSNSTSTLHTVFIGFMDIAPFFVPAAVFIIAVINFVKMRRRSDVRSQQNANASYKRHMMFSGDANADDGTGFGVAAFHLNGTDGMHGDSSLFARSNDDSISFGHDAYMHSGLEDVGSYSHSAFSEGHGINIDATPMMGGGVDIHGHAYGSSGD